MWKEMLQQSFLFSIPLISSFSHSDNGLTLNKREIIHLSKSIARISLVKASDTMLKADLTSVMQIRGEFPYVLMGDWSLRIT